MTVNTEAVTFSTSSVVVETGLSVIPSLALLLVIISDMGEFQA
jgi:hypothetical protein